MIKHTVCFTEIGTEPVWFWKFTTASILVLGRFDLCLVREQFVLIRTESQKFKIISLWTIELSPFGPTICAFLYTIFFVICDIIQIVPVNGKHIFRFCNHSSFSSVQRCQAKMWCVKQTYENMQATYQYFGYKRAKISSGYHTATICVSNSNGWILWNWHTFLRGGFVLSKNIFLYL